MEEKEISKQILKELQSINRKLEVIGSNFELRDSYVQRTRMPDGTRVKKRVKRNLDYLG